MRTRHWMIATAVLAGAALAGSAQAQDAPATPPQEDVQSAPPPTVAAVGPEWRAFSRSGSSVSLIDGGDLEPVGDEVHVQVARVPLTGAAGDYSYVLDTFSVRCDARQSHLISSAEALEDGVLTEPYDADEPWSDIAAGSFDEGVLNIGCGKSRATGTAFESIKAYIDAGRP